MKVRELIEKLQGYSPESDVMIFNGLAGTAKVLSDVDQAQVGPDGVLWQAGDTQTRNVVVLQDDG